MKPNIKAVAAHPYLNEPLMSSASSGWMVRWWVLVHSLAASNEAVASVCTLLVQYKDLQGTMRPSQWESLHYLQRTSFRYIVQYG